MDNLLGQRNNVLMQMQQIVISYQQSHQSQVATTTVDTAGPSNKKALWKLNMWRMHWNGKVWWMNWCGPWHCLRAAMLLWPDLIETRSWIVSRAMCKLCKETSPFPTLTNLPHTPIDNFPCPMDHLPSTPVLTISLTPIDNIPCTHKQYPLPPLLLTIAIVIVNLVCSLPIITRMLYRSFNHHAAVFK